MRLLGDGRRIKWMGGSIWAGFISLWNWQVHWWCKLSEVCETLLIIINWHYRENISCPHVKTRSKTISASDILDLKKTNDVAVITLDLPHEVGQGRQVPFARLIEALKYLQATTPNTFYRNLSGLAIENQEEISIRIVVPTEIRTEECPKTSQKH